MVEYDTVRRGDAEMKAHDQIPEEASLDPAHR